MTLLRNDWGDRRANFRFAADHPGSHAFVADADGEIVGTGIATVNGAVGWIGTIWVDPDWRRRGLGMALTQATIDAAEAAGCRTLVLVATDAGRPMYERIGFEVQTTYRILEAPGLGGGRPDPRIRAFRREDLAMMAAMDRAATGEDRTHLLRAFAAPGTSRCVIRADGAIGGFVVRAPWGGGATIAPDPVDAATILRARRVAAGPEKRVRAGLLAENADGIAMLLADGWTEAWDGPRLIRGEPFDWHPDVDLGTVQPRDGLSAAQPPARTACSVRRACPRWTRSCPPIIRNIRSTLSAPRSRWWPTRARSSSVVWAHNARFAVRKASKNDTSASTSRSSAWSRSTHRSWS